MKKVLIFLMFLLLTAIISAQGNFYQDDDFYVSGIHKIIPKNTGVNYTNLIIVCKDKMDFAGDFKITNNVVLK